MLVDRPEGDPIAQSGDAALVNSFRTGAPGAGQALVDRYGPYITRLVVLSVGIDPEVPDLVNDVFAEALESIGTVREPAALKGWIRSVALTTAHAFLRKRTRRGRWVNLSPPEALPERRAAVAPPEVCQALRRTFAILERLPAEERNVLSLRLVDAKLAEIAEATGTSITTVKRRLRRAGQRFHQTARLDPLLRDYVPPP